MPRSGSRSALPSSYPLLGRTKRKEDETMTQGTHLAVPVSERDHRQGPATAAVTLVQYGDYECPYTRLSTHVVRAAAQEQARHHRRRAFHLGRRRRRVRRARHQLVGRRLRDRRIRGRTLIWKAAARTDGTSAAWGKAGGREGSALFPGTEELRRRPRGPRTRGVIAAYVTSGQHSCPGVDHLLKGNQNDYSEHD